MEERTGIGGPGCGRIARIARQEPVLAKHVFERRIHFDQRASDAVTHRTGLARKPAALRLDDHIVATAALRCFERLTHDLLELRAGKIFFDRLFVYGDDALAEHELHARNRALTAAGGLNLRAIHVLS